MKKTIMILGFIGILMSCKSLNYPQPSFEKDHSFVIDSFSQRGSLEDRVRIYNQTTKTSISFTVYVHDPKDNVWKIYGTGNLKGPGDSDFVSSNLSGDLEDYRYFAIVALDGNNYAYSFYKKSNDLHITITDK